MCRGNFEMVIVPVTVQIYNDNWVTNLNSSEESLLTVRSIIIQACKHFTFFL